MEMLRNFLLFDPIKKLLSFHIVLGLSFNQGLACRAGVFLTCYTEK